MLSSHKLAPMLKHLYYGHLSITDTLSVSEDTNVIENLPLQLDSHLTLFRTAAKSLAKVNYRQCLEITPLRNIAREMTVIQTPL